MKIVMRTALLTRKTKTLGETWETIEKALTHKYISRIPKKNGKGWEYIYKEYFENPLHALKTLFGFKEEKVDETYEKNHIQQDYGADKKTFAAHILEYFANKGKWDAFFSKKENREQYTKPRNMETVKQVSTEKLGKDSQQELGFEEPKKTADTKDKGMTLNRSLMRKIYGIYNEVVEHGADHTNPKQGTVPAGTPAIRGGGSKEPGDQHVHSAEQGDNQGESLQLPFDTGERTGRDVRLTKKQTKAIRQACISLLESKTDSEMTEADKALLRQYEGAGGLGENDTSTHGTLYEYYTPRTVTKKVWQLVDKYIPGAKHVLEPSAGIGRFAEDRPNDTFTLNEYDKTSSRIAGILHPEADVQQGAFQALFNPGKDYTGNTYDVVIGNPPYGAYEGIYKGKGEGKDHSRYEEYFIDRGLDTLREGGIMAFVVPSSFLRGGNSKIKEKIAAKGQLMEAWRLPNGTFNTTGVGTDIIILRKEKGDTAAFSNNAYFKDNPGMVVGTETVRSGRFGEEHYVALEGEDTFDQAIDRIKADKVEAVPIGEKTVKEQAQEQVSIKESAADAHENRSEAMQGNDNAKKDSVVQNEEKHKVSFRDFTEGFDIGGDSYTEKYGRYWKLELGPRSGRSGRIRQISKEEYRTAQEQSGVEQSNQNAKKDSTNKNNGGLGLNAVLDEFKRRKTERNSKLGREVSETIERLQGIDDVEEVYVWLESAKSNLRAAKNAPLTEIKRQYEYAGSVEIAGNILHADDILDRVSPADIKEQLIYNAQQEVDAIQKKIAELENNHGLFDAPQNAPQKQGGSQSEAMQGNQNAAGKHEVDTAAEFNAKYNKHIAPEALPVWKATAWDGSIDLQQLDEKNQKYLEDSGNYVKSADGNWYDVVNFASGNIYDKLDQLEKDRAVLSPTAYQRQKSILENALPKTKSVTEFEISPLSTIAEEFITSETATPDYRRSNHQTQPEEKKLNLKEAFKRWVQSTPKDQLALPEGINGYDLIKYTNAERVTTAKARHEDEKDANRLEAQRKVTDRREAAERLFNQYVREQLSLEDQRRLTDAYNRKYNATVQADFSKIPVFLEGISKSFKEQEFRANESQIKGVSWLANQGNGIVAFDVGVGKTITAIMAAMNDIQMGRCKKPVMIVPKSVYKNWISEITQLFPQVKINELGNFSDIAKYKNKDGSLNIEDGSISLCTYEALNKIGFSDETLNGELAESFSEALSSLTDEEEANILNNKKIQRKSAKDKESTMTKVGKAARTGDNWINWENTGFDHITTDEAHKFRNSFAKPKNKHAGDADEFKDIPGGSESIRGLKLFAMTQMVQKQNNGRNVHLLTATPFENSPVEIYNMLSLVAREQLKKAGIYNFHEFLTQFAELKPELSVDSKGNIAQKNVMKGFKNLPALQKLINQYIMKIDGEDAGIIRPDKTDHIIELNPTAEQRDITEKIRAYMEVGPDPEKDPGATLRCINALRQAALSPALVDGFKFMDEVAKNMAGIREQEITIRNDDFVKDSPKLTFVCDTTANLYQQHPDKGQIIHLPQGVSEYGKVRDYLVAKGVPKDAIAFMAPEYLKSGDAGNDQKEEITQAFNDPNNKLKIIIGSDTIKEGVNLNGNTIQTYATMLDWNPTGTQQLKGRSWRQGNKQGMVHITFPLVNDSVDSFMYQKHDEKGSRLNTLWNSDKDKIDISGIDPEELKFSLIKDPKKRADMFIKEKRAALESKQKIAAATSDKIFTMAGERKNYQEENESSQSSIDRMKKSLANFNAKSDAAISKEYELDFTTSYKNFIYDDFVGVIRGKNMKEIRDDYAKTIKEKIADKQKTIQRNKGKMETIDNTLARYGIDNPGNTTLVERMRKKYSMEAIGYKEQIEAIENNRDQYIKDAAAQIAKESKPGVSVNEAVTQNTAAVSDNLYAMDMVRNRIQVERGKQGNIKKALILFMRKKIAVRVKGRNG